jgi:hypothetical protein
LPLFDLGRDPFPLFAAPDPLDFAGALALFRDGFFEARGGVAFLDALDSLAPTRVPAAFNFLAAPWIGFLPSAADPTAAPASPPITAPTGPPTKPPTTAPVSPPAAGFEIGGAFFRCLIFAI